jgi:hypothetical protein
VIYTKEDKFKKWFKRPELEMTLFSLTTLRLGLFFGPIPDDPPDLYLPQNTGILGMMGLKTLSFSKAWILLKRPLTSSTGS